MSPNEMRGNPGLLLLIDDFPFINPTGLLPAFELNQHFIGIHRLVEVEKDLTHDGLAGEVEWLVDLYEYLGHN